MASPFTVFRKNQKILLATTGILAMIAFVFLGTCVKGTGPAQAYQDDTVVSWKYGDIKESEMANRIQMRKILNEFVNRAMMAAGQRPSMQSPFPETEDAVVRSMVLARRGRELQLVVSDDMVNRVLAQLTNNRVRPADFERITAQFQLGGRQRVTPKEIFDALREELLARHVEMLFLEGLGVDTPAQRWDYFRRFERQVTAQILAVPVAEFTEEVKKPSDQELQTLFEKYKDRMSSVESPEPGFRQPYRARFQYFKADIDELAKAEMDGISDEDIGAYYEKNKDKMFRKSKLKPIDEKDGKEAAEKKDGEADSKAQKDNESKPSAEGKESTKDGGTEKKADSGKDTKAGDAKGKEEGGGGREKDGDTNADATKAQGKSAYHSSGSPYRLARFQSDKAKRDNQPATDAKKATPDSKKKEQRPATGDKRATDTSAKGGSGKAKQDAGKGETKDSKAGKTDGKKQSQDSETSKEKTDKGATTETSPPTTSASKESIAKEESKAAPDGDESKAKEEPAAGSDKKEESTSQEPEYRPLEDVRDEIRRTLARERAGERVKDRLDKLRTEMSRYAERRTFWQIESAANPDEPKQEPKPLDFEALAEKHGVKAFATEMLSRSDVELNQKLDIAKSFEMNARSFNFQTWPQIAFQPKGLYRPIMTTDLEGSGYLSWKTEEREGHIPEFKEVRAEVLEAWKRIKARDLAKKKAQEYAKTVREAKQPMKEVFAYEKNLPVKDVGPFSWLVRPNVPFGTMQPPPQYGKAPGVDTPGEEFMQTTFNLKAGEVGVAFNEPQSIAYVIQANRFDPSDGVLEQEFMVRMKNYDRYRDAGLYQVVESQNQWMESLFKEYGVHWHRTADLRLAMAQ